jgi:hypothetical protein
MSGIKAGNTRIMMVFNPVCCIKILSDNLSLRMKKDIEE